LEAACVQAEGWWAWRRLGALLRTTDEGEEREKHYEIWLNYGKHKFRQEEFMQRILPTLHSPAG